VSWFASGNVYAVAASLSTAMFWSSSGLGTLGFPYLSVLVSTWLSTHLKA
jgi:hypothetical protein